MLENSIIYLYENRIEHIYTRVYEVFLFNTYIHFAKNSLFSVFLLDHIQKSWMIIHYAMKIEEKTDEEFWEKFKDFCKINDIKIPKIVDLFLKEKLTIVNGHILKNYNIKEKDLKEMVVFSEDVYSEIELDLVSLKLDDRKYYFEIIGKELQKGKTRRSGNSSAVTLPKSWQDKKVASILIE